MLMVMMREFLLILLLVLGTHQTVSWSFDPDSEADIHAWARRYALPGTSIAIKEEILLIGDGHEMKFWPLWGFYQYVARASSSFKPSIKLVTSTSPGFRFGMMWEQLVHMFGRSSYPILYFLVSPGDRPLPVTGLRHYPGIKILDVEDMEGEQRLEELIVGNKIDYVTFRYFNDELIRLQALCKETKFHHLPFFLNPSHFYSNQETAGVFRENRAIDVLVYGNTWSHRYPLRHRVLRALTTLKHNMTFEVVAHPGYYQTRDEVDFQELLCSRISPEFWELSRVDGHDLTCCHSRRCSLRECREVSWKVMQGPLSSCDDIKTCPSPAALEAMTALKSCLPDIRGKQLGDKLRRSKIVIACSIQGSTDHGFHVAHSYLVAKYHEISLCRAVVAGDLPLSGHGMGLQGSMIHLDPEMSDDEMLSVLSEAVSDINQLLQMANSSYEFFRWNTFARGTMYWTNMLRSMLYHKSASPSLLGSGLAQTEITRLSDGTEYAKVRYHDRWRNLVSPIASQARHEDCLRSLFEDLLVKSSKPRQATRMKLVDVGAGGGTESLIAAVRGWDVIAFEILKDNVALLQEAITLNGVEDRICVFHAAAYDCTGILIAECFLTDIESGGERLHNSQIRLKDFKHSYACQKSNQSHSSFTAFTSTAFTLSRDSLQGFVLGRDKQPANENDMKKWMRNPDGTFRMETAKPIATELVNVICLDNFLNREQVIDVMLIQDFPNNEQFHLTQNQIVAGSAKLFASGLVKLVMFDNRRRRRMKIIHEMLMMDFCVVDVLNLSDQCNQVVTDVCLEGQGNIYAEDYDWIVFKHARASVAEDRQSLSPAVFTISEAKLQDFAKLQMRMFDPNNREVERKFLVLRSGHGIANTMLEEISALLVALASGRALVFAYDSDIFGLERPSDCFHRPFPMSLEEALGLQEGMEQEGRAEKLNLSLVSGDTGRGYARYHEMAACTRPDVSLRGKFVVLQHFYSFPALFLNPSVTSLLDLDEEEEEEEEEEEAQEKVDDVFQRLHAFLHRPAQSILREARQLWQEQLKSSPCSVGVQFRWHHLSERRGGKENQTHLEQVSKMFFDQALSVCEDFFQQSSRLNKLNRTSVALWISSDYSFVYDVFQDLAHSVTKVRVTIHHLSKADIRIHSRCRPPPPCSHDLLTHRPDDVGDLSGDHDDHVASLLDMEILSSCRFLICTRLSTFGFVAYARRSNVNGRSHRVYYLCDGESASCRRVTGRLSGLVAGHPVHQGWPWTEQKLKQVSCFPRSEGAFDLLKHTIFQVV
eukprot:768263-Hanusia_phi.AAC.7